LTARRLTALMALPIAVVLGASACDGGSSTSGGAAGGPVTIGISEPAHLVPGNTVENNGYQVLSALFTPLVEFDGKGAPVFDNAAATSIDSTDKKVWTVHLRAGLTFHDGTPVTANSYLKAWNYGAYGPDAQAGTSLFGRIDGYDDLQSADGTSAPKARTMSGLKAVDEHTLQITLSQPFAEWEKVLGYSAFYPLPDAAFAADGTLNKTFEDSPIGDGPFQLKGSWNHNRTIDVTRYANYTLAKPKVDEVDFKIYQDEDTAYADLRAGKLDVLPQLPSEKLAGARADLGDRLKKTPSSYFGFVTVPTFDPAYKPAVRKAISMAIDRQGLVNKLLQGAYTPATSWVSPIVQGSRDNTCGDACRYDPTAAKELYTKAGGVPGNKIQLYYNADGGHKEWVDALCGQVSRNLGVQCTGAPVAHFADLRGQARDHTLQGLLRGAWAFDYPSIEDYLTPLYKTGASSNDAQYSNPDFDQTLSQADQATDEASAIKGYQHAEDIVAKDLPTIPLWFKQNVYGYSARLKSVDLDLFGNVDVRTLERS